MTSITASDADKAALRVDILDGYQQLAAAYEQMNQVLGELNAQQVPQLTDKLREIERKFGLVYQLFKSSVYAIVKDGAPEPQDATVGHTL